MFCFKCGFNMPDTATVCPQCSTPVQSAPQPPAPSAAPSGQPASPWLNVPAMQTMPNQALRPGMEPPTDGKATASLVLGILSVTCLGLLAGIPAIVLGHISRKNIQQSMGRLKGDGMATAGLVMGYISVALIPVVLIIAAIAIPSLLRSRMAANDSAAASTLRTINTGQVAYLTSYPTAGYARDLASMGPGSGDCTRTNYPSEQHACLVDGVLGAESCTDTNWCTKYGFKFAVVGICSSNLPCSGYVVTATPVQFGTSGTRSFCSVSDGVIRYKDREVASPLTTEEDCAAWPAIM